MGSSGRPTRFLATKSLVYLLKKVLVLKCRHNPTSLIKRSLIKESLVASPRSGILSV
jgi:hypothetical protein